MNEADTLEFVLASAKALGIPMDDGRAERVAVHRTGEQPARRGDGQAAGERKLDTLR